MSEWTQYWKSFLPNKKNLNVANYVISTNVLNKIAFHLFHFPFALFYGIKKKNINLVCYTNGLVFQFIEPTHTENCVFFSNKDKLQFSIYDELCALKNYKQLFHFTFFTFLLFYGKKQCYYKFCVFNWFGFSLPNHGIRNIGNSFFFSNDEKISHVSWLSHYVISTSEFTKKTTTSNMANWKRFE